MNLLETKKIIAVMMITYPNYKPDDVDLTASVWMDMMSDYSYQQVSIALKSFIQINTSGFAPTIGELIDIIHKASTPEQLSEMEAWTLVSNALRNGCYGAEEEFEKLPPIVQKAIGAPSQLRNWSQTDSDSVENVIQSNFLRTYRAVVAREREIAKMPPEAKALIDRANADRLKLHTQKESVLIEGKSECAEYNNFMKRQDDVKELGKKLLGE